MAQDWAADVKKFVANADDEVINAIVKYCGIALHNQDSSLVSFTDSTETDRVRENFLKKKLGLTQSDADLDAGIAAVGERMKGTNFKNRVTVYYLLLEQFGMMDFFRKGASAVGGAVGAAAGAGAAAAAGLAASAKGKADDADAAPVAPAAKVEAAPVTPAPAPEPVASSSTAAPAAALGATAATAAGATAAAASGGNVDTRPLAAASNYDSLPVHHEPAYVEEESKSGLGWLWWLLGALLLLALLWWLFFRQPAAAPVDATVGDTAATASATPDGTAATGDGAPASDAPVTDLTKAPAEGTATIPAGAGVTSELRDSKPVVKVYFDTAKTDVAPAFAASATALKAYLDSHAGSKLAVSGFNDPRGDAAKNAELSKNRAQAVQAELVKAGIAETSIELVKPEAATDTTTDNANARRVEVVVR